jgi:hypothetical protein
MTSNGVFNENKNKKMIKESKLKWGDRTVARVDEVGYTNLKDVIIAEVHESVADKVGTWNLPEELYGMGSSDVSVKKPRAGAYHKCIRLKDIVHEKS